MVSASTRENESDERLSARRLERVRAGLRHRIGPAHLDAVDREIPTSARGFRSTNGCRRRRIPRRCRRRAASGRDRPRRRRVRPVCEVRPLRVVHDVPLECVEVPRHVRRPVEHDDAVRESNPLVVNAHVARRVRLDRNHGRARKLVSAIAAVTRFHAVLDRQRRAFERDLRRTEAPPRETSEARPQRFRPHRRW